MAPQEFEQFVYQLYDFGLLETIDTPAAAALIRSVDAPPGYLDYVDPEPLIQRVPWGITLCDPSPLLRLMAWIGKPMKYGVWLSIPAVYFAGLIFYRYQNQLFADLQTMQIYVSLFVAVICAFFLDNLVARLIQGAIATAYGTEIRLLGVSAFLGFLPRFFIEDMPIKRLSRSGMLWCYASPLLFRFFLFSGGIFLWFAFRGVNTVSWVGLLCAQLGFYSGLLSLWPILPGDAYRWLSTYVNDPNLRTRSLRLMLNMARGLPLPPTLSSAERWSFFLFASSHHSRHRRVGAGRLCLCRVSDDIGLPGRRNGAVDGHVRLVPRVAAALFRKEGPVDEPDRAIARRRSSRPVRRGRQREALTRRSVV